MKKSNSNTVFLVGAIFNWFISAGLFFVPEYFLGLIDISPAPEQSVWVQQFAGLVFVFGIGYYWASKNLEENLSIIKLAVLGKLGVVIIGLLNVICGAVSWQLMFPASIDLVFAILFIYEIKRLK